MNFESLAKQILEGCTPEVRAEFNRLQKRLSKTFIFPGNPRARKARDKAMFELISFARQHGLMICVDLNAGDPTEPGDRDLIPRKRKRS